MPRLCLSSFLPFPLPTCLSLCSIYPPFFSELALISSPSCCSCRHFDLNFVHSLLLVSFGKWVIVVLQIIQLHFLSFWSEITWRCWIHADFYDLSMAYSRFTTCLSCQSSVLFQVEISKLTSHIVEPFLENKCITTIWKVDVCINNGWINNTFICRWMDSLLKI